MPREIDEITEGWRDEAYPRIVQAGDLRRVAAELERLRAMEKRASEKANAPRRLDGAASWDVAAHILGALDADEVPSDGH